MPVVSKIEIFNRASARIRADLMQSPEENSLVARECRRFYPEVIGDMLEGDHDWSFANQRVRLAQLSANDRSQEWLYAYQLPSNMAGGGAIKVIPDLEAAGVGLGLPVPLPGEPFMEGWSTPGLNLETPYEIEGSTLYSNVENAILEFAVDDITNINLPRRVITAITLDLASRIAVPVKADKQREQSLQAAAMVMFDRAIADDRNRQPQQTGQYVSEIILARHGYQSGPC